jgi:hypothetical protein
MVQLTASAKSAMAPMRLSPVNIGFMLSPFFLVSYLVRLVTCC